MRWQFWSTISVLAMLLAGLAWWQYREFMQEDRVAHETLHRQGHSVMNALVGGIKSHRRRGRFFMDQLAGSLQGLVGGDDILAVGIASPQGTWLESAGQSELLPPASDLVAGDFWDPTGYRLAQSFTLGSDVGETREHAGAGLGRPGRSPPLTSTLDAADAASPFSDGGDFVAVLILDRSPVDQRRGHAARLRGALVVAGGLLLLGLALAWQTTVQAAGRARQLEAESRHLRELEQAAAGLAHETRNPLGLIRGWAQRLVQTGFQSPEQQEQAEAIVEECDRVTARLNQFLSFAHPREPQLETVDVRRLAGELAMLLESDLDEKDSDLQCHIFTASAQVLADSEMLRQALFNLVQNAIQASPTGQAVEISLRVGQDVNKRIEVADRGPTIPVDVVESLFTPYFTTRPDGTGLGLAIVRNIASRHGWQAGYTPRSGGGSIFWLDRLHG